MQPRASAYRRDLGELNQLADLLFTVVRNEYGAESAVTLRLDRSDRLVHRPVSTQDVAAATLLCAQLLRRATTDPETAHPRQVVGLTDFIDQLIPSLLAERRRNGGALEHLHAIQARIDEISMNLALLSDPGAPGYADP